jgi:hypothetical protein
LVSARSAAMNAYFSLTAAPSRSTPPLRCESPDHTRARQCLRGEASVGFFDCVIRPVWSGGWGDGDVHSEFFELAHEPAGLLIG